MLSAILLFLLFYTYYNYVEISLLMKCRRVSSVKATTLCDLYTLSNEDYQQVLDMFPVMREQMEFIAKQRLSMIGLSNNEESPVISSHHSPSPSLPSVQISKDVSQSLATVSNDLV